MTDSFPSVCPDCGAMLDHSTAMPGGVNAPVIVDCPDCEFEERFGGDD